MRVGRTKWSTLTNQCARRPTYTHEFSQKKDTDGSISHKSLQRRRNNATAGKRAIREPPMGCGCGGGDILYLGSAQ